MARSDIWRFRRHADKARELATVTSGITSYFGSAARDRGYRVTWGPIANTYGGTDVKGKRVILNPALLDKLSPEAPFTGEAVDAMQGVAAHEAGHAVIADTHGRDGYEGIIGNVVEDLMIDGPAFASYNPGLAEETKALRENMAHDFFPPIDEVWRDGPTPMDKSALLTAWACARLFREKLAQVPRRKFEQRYVDALDVVGDRLWSLDDFTGPQARTARVNAITDIKAILDAYDNDPAKPEPQPGKGEQGEPDDSAQGEGDPQSGDGEGSESECENGLSGEPSEGEGKSSGKGSKSDEDSDDDAEGSGSGDDEDERINGEDAEPGDSGDDPSVSDDEGDDDGDPSNSAGSASKKPTPKDWDSKLPEVCPSMHGEAHEQPTPEEKQFWEDVAKELEALDISRGQVQGKVHMAKYTDKKTVAGVKAALQRMASEPAKQRHFDSGRLDRRGLARATYADDIFTRQRDKALAGQVVVVLDLSGSVRGHEPLLKSAAASVYEALAKTDLKVWVYSYGSPNVAELATPKKVHPVFDRIGAGGGTPTTQAFAAVLKDVKAQRTGANIIIHITDGVADHVPSAQEEMRKARRTGWKVINIGVKTGHLPYEAYSDSTQYISDYTKLPTLMTAAVTDIVKGLRSRAASGV